MDTIKFYLYYLDSIFVGYPFIIRTTVTLVMLLITLYVIAMLKILITERRRNREINRQEKISETYKSKLMSVLLTDKDMLEDYLILTINKAIEKATNVNETELAAVAKEGMPNIPGLDMFR